MKEHLFYYLLLLTCVTLFTYELSRALSAFIKEEVVTKTSQQKQEDFPRPKICISSKYLMRTDQIGDLFGENISHLDYQNGRWTAENSNLTEEDIFDKVAPEITDLIDKLSIENTTNTTGLNEIWVLKYFFNFTISLRRSLQRCRRGGE